MRNHARDVHIHKKLSSNGSLSSDGSCSTLSHVISVAEKNHIKKVLRVTNGNKKKAAEILGISRKTLWEKIKSHGITQ